MVPSLSKLSHEQLTSGVQPPVSHTLAIPETLWGNGLSYVAIASLADLRYIPEHDFQRATMPSLERQHTSQTGFPKAPQLSQPGFSQELSSAPSPT